MNKIIEIKKLNKKFGNIVVHNNLSLDVIKGERTAIIGENGSGKTLLLNELCGLIKPDSGEIKINGTKNLQFQNFEIDLNLTVIEFIEINLKLINLKVNNEIIKMLEDFELFWIKNHFVNKISAGQKQRINLFLAIVNNPEILMLDEFTNGLDIVSAKGILDHINLMIDKYNMTLLIVSHQPEELRNLTDRIVFLDKGNIKNDWKTSDIEEKYNGNFSKFLTEVIGSTKETKDVE